MNKKKKIVLSIVLAAVLVMAMSVTAFAAAPSVSVSNPSPNVGDTVTFTVSCPSDVAGIQGDIATSGLQYVSRTTTPAGMGGENTLVTLGNSASYTYKVTAAAGETVSFALSNVITADVDGNETPETGTFSATATVAAPAEPTSQPTGQPTSDPTEEPSASASASAKAGGLDDVPKTGDTTTDIMLFAVIGLAAAATVAIVAGKKALSHK
ncbi:hypothetical protein [Christensenella hongkongensis]|uniref:Gram-positive cocci surface proteins LPxTG domain-containing protein n=1 Tax=Christensenella hongkongensis TaxID=270498 RepID=A0A0M2NK76_9FIRM|nr:hypothetical protein [Christensenella hongkongensis]KKI50852.1 hypothetical protein CHK_1778 [Christensenella hongkongensis]TCW29676.1 hypothetical protein EV208_10414 [Christensenella hongkongensis]